MRAAVLALLTLVAACGDEGSLEPVADAADFVARAPVSECKHLVRCGLYGGVDECIAHALQRGESLGPRPLGYDELYSDAVERGAATFDRGNAERCLAALERRSCSPFVHDPAALVCSEVFAGTIAPGAEAHHPVECVSGAWDRDVFCDPHRSCCSGACGQDPYLPRRGEPCGGDGLCGPGLACTSDVCAPAPTEGCGGCPDGYACDGERCLAPGKTSDECVDWDVGLGGVISTCNEIAAWCRAEDHRCHRYALAGERCDDRVELCAPGLACDGGRCVGFVGNGEPCSAGLACARGLLCSTERDEDVPTCKALALDGASCASADVCASRYCDPASKLCAPRPACP